jgi:hypothetical protein
MDIENITTSKPAAMHEKEVNNMVDQLVPWSNALQKVRGQWGDAAIAGDPIR